MEKNFLDTMNSFNVSERKLASGITDFDVIDGRDEFLEAAEWLGLRASAGIETRALF